MKLVAHVLFMMRSNIAYRWRTCVRSLRIITSQKQFCNHPSKCMTCFRYSPNSGQEPVHFLD